MKLIVCDNYDQIAKKASEIMIEQIKTKPDSVLGLAIGSTPVGVYSELVRHCSEGDIDMSQITTFNLDEYYPIAPTNKNSYHYFMNKHLFSGVNVRPENIHIPDGMAKDPKKECEDFDKKIDAAGGIDLQIMGVGQNGHIGFNYPEANLYGNTHLTKLNDYAMSSVLPLFENPDEAPRHAITMGVGTIMKAKKIVILASGASKQRVVQHILKGMICTNVPATMVNAHFDVTIICDRDAYEGVRIGVDLGGTEIKLGVVNDKCEILKKTSCPTPQGAEADVVAQAIADQCKELMKEYPIGSIGIGTPGSIKNSLVSATNLKFKNFPLAQAVKEKTGLPVYVANDANCATLAEAHNGAAQDTSNSILLTLGTGVGGGIIFDGKLYEGSGCAGELGHICLVHDGTPCGCGLNGCFEKYASTTALIEMAVKAATENPNSVLAAKYENNSNSLNGILFFESIKENCPVAKKVLDQYTDYLASGINGLIYAFDPEKVILSGGISAAGDMLLEPLKKKIKFDIPIVIAAHKNSAGIIGASLLH